MIISLNLSKDKNIIKIYDEKNIKLLCQDLFDISLKYGRYIGQFEKYYLIFKVVIANFKSRFLFITFFNFHLIINIG